MAGYTEYLESTNTLGFVGYLSAVLAFGPMLAFVLLGELDSLTGSVAVGLTVVAFLSVLLVSETPSGDGEPREPTTIGGARKRAASGR